MLQGCIQLIDSIGWLGVSKLRFKLFSHVVFLSSRRNTKQNTIDRFLEKEVRQKKKKGNV